MVAWLTVPGLAGAQQSLPEGPPETRIVRSPPRIAASRLAEFEFESDDPQARFECSLDGAGFFGCASPLRLYARIRLGEKHTLEIRARNAEGLEDPSPASHTWRALLELPWQPVITQPVAGDRVEGSTLHVAGLSSPGSTVRVLMDGRPGVATQADEDGLWQLTVPVDEGPHTLFAELEDEAGEAMTPAQPVPFTVSPEAAEQGETLGCSGGGGAPALLLIGLVAIAITSGRRRCRQKSPVSSGGCDCCR